MDPKNKVKPSKKIFPFHLDLSAYTEKNQSL